MFSFICILVAGECSRFCFSSECWPTLVYMLLHSGVMFDMSCSYFSLQNLVAGLHVDMKQLKTLQVRVIYVRAAYLVDQTHIFNALICCIPWHLFGKSVKMLHAFEKNPLDIIWYMTHFNIKILLTSLIHLQYFMWHNNDNYHHHAVVSFTTRKDRCFVCWVHFYSNLCLPLYLQK